MRWRIPQVHELLLFRIDCKQEYFIPIFALEGSSHSANLLISESSIQGEKDFWVLPNCLYTVIQFFVPYCFFLCLLRFILFY